MRQAERRKAWARGSHGGAIEKYFAEEPGDGFDVFGAMPNSERVLAPRISEVEGRTQGKYEKLTAMIA